MKKEATGYGLTIEEAIEDAKNNLCAELAGTKFDEDFIEYDTISVPKKKTLGIFGGSKAEVVAFIELPDEKPKKAERKPAEKKAARAEKPAVQREKKTEEIEDTLPPEDTVPADELPGDSPAKKAVDYLRNILSYLGCENTEIKVAVKENGAALYLSGEGLGAVIGRRGETLDSLQYLCSLAANSAGGYYKVNINIGNYRQRREKSLESLARRYASQVLRTGRSRSLEPMNPYERRIIHTTVQGIDGVTSSSIGEGINRRVVISSERGANRGSRSFRQSAPAVDTAREPKKDAELPLYGKIN
ncbi:MAG: KH domain-containing protein [Clostridiales bacterium]|nr:KH domain-containing protein [Candidatus Equinaster intestinalis]